MFFGNKFKFRKISQVKTFFFYPRQTGDYWGDKSLANTKITFFFFGTNYIFQWFASLGKLAFLVRIHPTTVFTQLLHSAFVCNRSTGTVQPLRELGSPLLGQHCHSDQCPHLLIWSCAAERASSAATRRSRSSSSCSSKYLRSCFVLLCKCSVSDNLSEKKQACAK